MGRARHDLQLGSRCQFGGLSARGFQWHDLVIIPVDDQGGHRHAFEVFAQVGLREGLDAFVLGQDAARHALQPEGVAHGL